MILVKFYKFHKGRLELVFFHPKENLSTDLNNLP